MVVSGTLGISNAYNGTKLYIKHNIKEVIDYKNKINMNDAGISRVLSQMFGYSMEGDLLQAQSMTIHEIIETNYANVSSGFPLEIDTMLFKFFLFKVEITQANLDANWVSYNVKRLANSVDLINQFKSLHGIKWNDDEVEGDSDDTLSTQNADSLKTLNEGAYLTMSNVEDEQIIDITKDSHIVYVEVAPSVKQPCKMVMNEDEMSSSVVEES
ncbi:uncharacterized protein LOC113874491 [Abrus precatorius]|uniref:Uncharacterized protein LOC113874491 n=1 Tax=Abrus precatorius TaxID=3816 RepID=A0A8B8MLM7_ABRPR|nr:uncharacterized protein LOC113874491 [Abrus precatorius]